MKKTTLIGAVLGSSLLALSFTGGCSSNSGGGSPSDAGSDHTASSSSGSSSGSSSSSGNGSGSSSGSSSGSEGGTTNPPPPTLGTQIDRMGRPAINTALTGTFDPACTTGTCPEKDAYNADSNPTHWATYVPNMAAYLGIYDSLDGTCGNQPAFTAAAGYTTLAGLFADDVLWLNTANTTCSQYLGVELAYLGISNTDCGGRAPNENTLDLTYNILAGTFSPGMLPTGGGVTNGITAPSAPASTTFPYFSPPH
jgi:hypothetical protein